MQMNNQLDLIPLGTSVPMFSRYPGSKKSGDKYRDILGDQLWDVCVSGFLGAGHAELRSGAATVFGADKHHVYAMWSVAIHGGKEKFLRELESFKAGICREVISNYLLYPDMLGLNIQPKHLLRIPNCWEILKKVATKERREDRVSAAGQLIHKLTFGGVVRDAVKSKKLNVKYCLGQVALLAKWRPEVPDIKGQWYLSGDWRDAITEFRMFNLPGRSICILDPPYYLDPSKGRMTPCYRDHRPHDPATFDMAVEALYEAAACPTLDRIAWCNYYDENLDEIAKKVAHQFGFRLSSKSYGRCDSMHNGNGEARVMANDHLWILER